MGRMDWVRIDSIIVALLIGIIVPRFGEAIELNILFSAYTPPYVFQDKNEKGDGIVVEIVRESLDGQGYKIHPVYLPIGRSFKMFSEEQVDGTTIIQESSGLDANYSDYFMQYHNFAITRTDRNIAIHSMEDLLGKDIIAFQQADKYLGPKFGVIAVGNPRYSEMDNQERQVHMLLAGRTDIAIMDESIFRYYCQKLVREGKVSQEPKVTFHNIFPPTKYRAAFVDPKVRDAFNVGLAMLRANGRYRAIYDKYTRLYFDIKE
ncbi:MAG: transporter substrate-binding domain-containing protein [Magnetococcales bacterium]|nr:transporter substrate-binding domain-containing protein [Magnetococcales bacterium]